MATISSSPKKEGQKDQKNERKKKEREGVGARTENRSSKISSAVSATARKPPKLPTFEPEDVERGRERDRE